MDKQHCSQLRKTQQRLHDYLDNVVDAMAVDFTRDNIRQVGLKVKSIFTNVYIVMEEANIRVKHMEIKRRVAERLVISNIDEFINFEKPGGHMFNLIVRSSDLVTYVFLTQKKLDLKKIRFTEIILRGDLDLRNAKIKPEMFLDNMKIYGDITISVEQLNRLGESAWEEIESKHITGVGSVKVAR